MRNRTIISKSKISGFSMILCIFDFLTKLWRAGRCLKSFLDAVRNFLTEYELISSHGDPFCDQNHDSPTTNWHTETIIWDVALKTLFFEGPSEGVKPLQKDARQNSIQVAAQSTSRSLLWISMAEKTCVYDSGFVTTQFLCCGNTRIIMLVLCRHNNHNNHKILDLRSKI